MPPVYPSHLYIRCDRELRTALARGAAAQGESVSVFARRHLRNVVGLPVEPLPPRRGPAATVATDLHLAGASAREVTRSIATLTDRIYGKSE